MKYSEIIKDNYVLGKKVKGREYKIAILSNIMVHQSKEICEYFLRKQSVNIKIFLGEYDNIVQDSAKYQDLNAVIIFWEACNFFDGFQYKADEISNVKFETLVNKIKAEIDLVLSNLNSTSLVLINKFSTLVFNRYQVSNNRFNNIVDLLNQYLESNTNAYTNLNLIDVDRVISNLSIDFSVDLRYYYLSKTLYSIDFYKGYFEHIKPIFLSATGRAKKALIFDCDNTLWKGVLGEDGFDNINMFQEVQHLAVTLAKKGVIVGLCSKNNAKDIDNVLENHPDMILKDDSIVIKRINWDDKVSNLKSIAQDLNIGLDSFVFIDDSSFEIGLIQKDLPEVSVFQVPIKEYEYGLLFRKVSNLFYNPSQTEEDVAKIGFYKKQLKRLECKNPMGNIEDYLKTLGLKINLYIDDLSQISRISQMTQKTNQFNLTTKRYTENEIKKLINNESKIVISIGVSDKYGDHGITGLAILDLEELKIDTFLLSCRIIGRNIEYKFMNIIVKLLRNSGVQKIDSQYNKTMKNQQVSDYYSKCGFSLVCESNGNIEYCLVINNYKNKELEYIRVIDER